MCLLSILLFILAGYPAYASPGNRQSLATREYKLSDFRGYEEPLKQAVKDAVPGSTIIIDEDVYHRDNTYIILTKELTIKGENGATIFIDNKGNHQTGPFVYAKGKNDFTITIQDLTIDGSRYGIKNDLEDKNRLFEIESCDFILRNCIIQNMHYSGATGSGGQTEFISVFKYNYCEISNCTFQRIYSNIEGIFLKPKYNLFLDPKDRLKGIRANNHRQDNNYALITGNKFLADTRWNEKTQKIEFSDPNVFVSSWFGIFDGKCEFSNNYISGSNGSSVHLHVYDSKIINNVFGPICREGGMNINLDEAGFPYGFIPQKVLIKNNLFQSAGVAIQCYCGEEISIDNNTCERPFKTSEKYTAENCFLSMITYGFSKERYIKSFIIKNNNISGIGSFVNFVNEKLIIDDFVIENNNIRLADDFNKGMFIFYVAKLSQLRINNNHFNFGNYYQPFPSNPAGWANIQQLINIRWVPGGTIIRNVEICGNTFSDDLDTSVYSMIGETGDRSYVDMDIRTLPVADSIQIKGNKIDTKNSNGLLTHFLLCRAGGNKPNVVFKSNEATTMVTPLLSFTDYSESAHEGIGQVISKSAIEPGQIILRHSSYYFKGYYYYAVKEGKICAAEMKKSRNGYYYSGTAQFIRIEGKQAKRIAESK